MQWIVKDIKRFEKEQKPVISYMVKEFEMKKAADLYKRSTVSKTIGWITWINYTVVLTIEDIF